VVDTPAEKVLAEQEAAPEIPDQVHVKAAPVGDQRNQFPSRTVKPSKNKYRFVDTSVKKKIM
jgi:hypothetical protein